MLRMSKLLIACAITTAGLAAGAGPASAQNQEGLVNVAIEDVVVQVPVAIAANVCDVNVITENDDAAQGQCTNTQNN